MKFKAVIFDLDGTLLDTIADLGDSVNAVMKKYGFPEHDYETYKLFVGKGVENLISKSLPFKEIDENELKKYLSDMKDEYSRQIFNKTRPYPGINDLLDYLNTKRLSISVYSNKQDEFTKIMIKKYFPDKKFDFIIGSQESKPLKPDPSIPLEISEKLNIKPEEFLYLGDSGIDMNTAKNAGMFPAGVLWGFRTEKELRENGAKLLLKNPHDLIDFLEKK
jgi:phosphoglycolate phosphatase